VVRITDKTADIKMAATGRKRQMTGIEGEYE